MPSQGARFVIEEINLMVGVNISLWYLKLLIFSFLGLYALCIYRRGVCIRTTQGLISIITKSQLFELQGYKVYITGNKCQSQSYIN